MRVWDLHRPEVGTAIDPKDWRASMARRDALDKQTADLADVLQRNGVQVRTGTMCLVGAVTGAVRYQDAYRSICFLPSIAKQKRASILRDLAYFLKHEPGAQFARYMVITNGRPVPLCQLREKMREFGRDISRWSHEVRQEFGIDVVFRGMEFPLKDGDGTRLYSGAHLHANIIFMVRRKLSQDRWREFLEFTHRTFGTVLKDAGRLKNVREVVKYPFKPVDLEGSTDADILQLYHQTLKARIFEVQGSFREWRKQMREDGMRTAWLRGEPVLCEANKREPGETFEDEFQAVGNKHRLCGILPPMALFSVYKEPIYVIQGDPQTVWEKDESLRETSAEFRRWWHENGGQRLRQSFVDGLRDAFRRTGGRWRRFFSLDNRTVSVGEKLENRPPPDQLKLVGT